MITRFYVDNYKCLTNFEYKPKQFELVLGANGTGKTTVFEALDKVRRFVTGKEDARELFTFDTRTRWDMRSVQTFEIELEAAGSAGSAGSEDRNFQYRLEINLLSETARVEKETLAVNGSVFFQTEWRDQESQSDLLTKTLVMSDEGNFVDDHTGQIRGLVMPSLNAPDIDNFTPLSDPNQSMLSTYKGTVINHVLSNMHLVKLNPPLMTSTVGKTQRRPANDFSNFASYYLYLLQKKQGQVFELLPKLREAIFGFDQFAIEEDFDEGRHNLEIVHRRPPATRQSSEPIGFTLEELSDGQRALIGLYTLLYCTLEANTTLVIDEPENYVALRELQPWLAELQERLEERGGQVILISHHPEFINQMAPESAVQFKREEGGPVRIVPFRTEGFEGLTPAEVVARGWEL